jgi:hypothetical protein
MNTYLTTHEFCLINPAAFTLKPVVGQNTGINYLTLSNQLLLSRYLRTL